MQETAVVMLERFAEFERCRFFLDTGSGYRMIFEAENSVFLFDLEEIRACNEIFLTMQQ